MGTITWKKGTEPMPVEIKQGSCGVDNEERECRLNKVVAEMESALERIKNATFWDTSEPDTDFYSTIENAIANGIEILKEFR